MGCGSSKPEHHSAPMAQPATLPNGQVVYVQPQQQPVPTRKQKAGKAGTNLGFLGMLAG
jgi:hypothetical protein